MILQNTEESPLFYFFDSTLSETLQERHQLIRWAVSRRPSIEGLSFCKRLFFELEAGVEINLRRLQPFGERGQAELVLLRECRLRQPAAMILRDKISALL